jgi:2-polyprenyl-6-methoxyphenol hydroxylase-like FAD-dependent oxidoreductase
VSDLEHFVSPLGRVVIAGDAAHAIPPSVGQGGSISLEDAETLAITISSINAHQDITPASRRELLSRWEKHRKSRIEKVIERTKMGSTMRKATGSEAAQAEKEKNLQEGKTEDDLQWLYGYDGGKFETLIPP